LQALPSTDEYLSLVMQFILAFGISFQLPILVLLLHRAGIVTYDQLVKARRYMIVVAFVVAAIFTPPDVFSQVMLAVPLILLFEGALLVIKLTGGAKPKLQNALDNDKLDDDKPGDDKKEAEASAPTS
jgi:sec-independent protein translocase protein TatC